MMKRKCLFSCLFPMTALVISFQSCTFREDFPAVRSSDNLACYSSLLIRRAGLSSSSSIACVRTLDVFVYDSATDGSLDSYEHLELANPDDFPSQLEISSTSGEKDVVLAANLRSGDISYTEIMSYRRISSLASSLYEEDIDFPVLVGECRIKAGHAEGQGIVLYPLTARIRIRNFSVDFSGRGYSDSTLTDLRGYIINAQASCTLLGKDASPANDFINYGGLDLNCMRNVKSPEMLLHEGNDLQGCCLYCYPRADSSSDMQSPTMLVIEGRIGGDTYYYPFRISEGSLDRATDYIFDISINRSGASSPDKPIQKAGLQVELNIEKWKEHAWETVDY